MPDRSFLRWPFFEPRHRELADAIDRWAARDAAGEAEPADVDEACRGLVRRLGAAGWLGIAVPRTPAELDVRALCLVRETLARHAPLADFAFALQGLGSAPILLHGTPDQRERWLPGARDGSAIAAFALSEPDAGSDVAAMRTTATRDGDGWRLDGEKTWISNAGIAAQYVVFARTPELGERAIGAFVVEATNPGLTVAERIAVVAPHPLGRVVLDGCRVGAGAVLGDPAKGLRVALGTLDAFRATVGAAALGMARRALDEALAFVSAREAFGQRVADFQLTQARLADMALAIDASALLVYRAAWTRDTGAERVTREAAMAKLHATEAAQRVIDDAVQLLGGRGVVAGAVVARLYREIRALRIYEGTSEIQKLVIAGQLLAAGPTAPPDERGHHGAAERVR